MSIVCFSVTKFHSNFCYKSSPHVYVYIITTDNISMQNIILTHMYITEQRETEFYTKEDTA